jgi:ribosomal protein S18 acetylase RimI-like enzyme
MIGDRAYELSWEVHDDVPTELARAVDEGLGRANAAAAPLDRVERLSCFARQRDGGLVGGVIGRTWGRCCELQQVWVDPAHRRRGVATRLIGLFEARAVERGCRTFYLETFSFQAPSLYRALGYTVAAEIQGFPSGISRYLMVREFGGP